MADFAELGISVDSRDVARARDEFGRFVRAGAQAEQAVTRQGAAMSATWRRLAGAAGAAAGAIVGAFSLRAIGSTLASFDSSMSQVQAITRATGAEMEQLRAMAQQMGATTAFTASEAADGLRFLGMAGFTAAESMQAIPAVLNLATAASMGLADAADITSNIMSGFGIEAANAAGVADILAAASSRANTDVSQLGQAMSTVAPISASLGIGLADTAAAIGLMSDAGIQGERAGTALRGVLASLAGPTNQAAEALAAMGLSVQDVNPAAHSMETIFGRLRAAGLDTASAMAIFGREASSGALVLAEGSARLGEFGRELGNVSGEAARMASIMGDNLQGDFNRFRSSVEALIIAMGDAGLIAIFRLVTQTVTMVVLGITSAVQTISGAVAAFGDMIGGFEGYFIATAAAITTYFLPAIASAAAGLVTTLVPAIWGAVSATGAWVASLVTLRGALILTGLGAFVVAAGFVINSLLTLRERTGGWGEALTLLGDLASGVWAGIVESAGAIPIGLGGVWYRVKATFAALLSDLSNMWADFLQSITTVELGGMSTPFGDFSFGSLDLSSMLGDSVSSARNFAADQLERSSSYGASASEYAAAAADRAAAGFDRARTALEALRIVMSEAGETTTDTETALAAINDALAETPAAASAAAGGVSGVGDAAEEAQSRIERMAGNMSRFFMQAVQGGDAARNAVDGLLNRVMELSLNNVFMSLLGGLNLGGGFGKALSMVFNANGGVYTSPSLSAYSGQVVSSPTMFAFAKGAGVMGEAGPEAILPLRRGADGKLGVSTDSAASTAGNTIINITNNTGQQVETQERTNANGERQLDIAIGRSIGRGRQDNAFARYGAKPKALSR
ncbi:phage tail tape measure protein [Cereibacter sphaeroides]|nr:phage tail tape measure protein [Cereibacter sphaeroides]